MVNTKKFSDFDAGGDIENDNITVGLESGTNVQFDNPWTFLPPGATGDRPVPVPSIYYRLRLNTTLHVYEYYDPVVALWIELSGSGVGTINPGVTNDLAYYAANGQTLSPINSAINAVLASNALGVPSMVTTLPTGLTIPGATITSSTAQLTSGSVTAAPVAGSDLVNKTYADSLFGAGVTSITGTTNQVIASSPTGAVTLSLPQDIAPGSSPTFVGLTAGNLNFTTNTIISTNANGNINYSPNGTGVNFFTKDINIETNSNPAITIFSPDLLRTSYTKMSDGTPNFSIQKFTASGDAIIGLSPIPLNGAGDARVRMCRDSNTSSLDSGLQIHTADGTASIQHFLRSKSDSYLNNNIGNLGIGFSSTPNSKLEVQSNSSATSTEVIRLTNSNAAANTGVILSFQPNTTSTRAASIRSIQPTLGNNADLEFYVASGAPPVLAMTINPDRSVYFANGLSFDAGTNILSNYVKRTGWTPVFTFATPGNLVLSGVSTTAFYQRVGDQVTLTCDYTFTPTFTTSTGNATITGLPIASVASGGAIRTTVAFVNVTYPAGSSMIFLALPGSSSSFTFLGLGTGGVSTNLTTANFTSGTAYVLRFTTQYFVN